MTEVEGTGPAGGADPERENLARGGTAFISGVRRCFAAAVTPPSVLLGLDPRIHLSAISSSAWIRDSEGLK